MTYAAFSASRIITFLYSSSLPRWTNTIQVLYYGWEIVHVLVCLLDGSEPAKRLEDLMNKFGDIGSRVKTVYEVRIVYVPSPFIHFFC